MKEEIKPKPPSQKAEVKIEDSKDSVKGSAKVIESKKADALKTDKPPTQSATLPIPDNRSSNCSINFSYNDSSPSTPTSLRKSDQKEDKKVE